MKECCYHTFVNEIPQQDEKFGTFGIIFVTEIRPFKVKFSVQALLQCIFKAQFINSANALLLTALYFHSCQSNHKPYSRLQYQCCHIFKHPLFINKLIHTMGEFPDPHSVRIQEGETIVSWSCSLRSLSNTSRVDQGRSKLPLRKIIL